jgi:mannose-6-phosphate isomerase
MPKLDTPLLLAPDFKEKIWGRENLEPLYPPPDMGPANESSNSAAPGPESSAESHHDATIPQIGEAWLTGEKAAFLSGPVAGLTLGEVMNRWPTELCGSNYSGGAFPFLAKFLFTSDWLSMQVHPNDRYAARHEKSRGKTEAWYFIDCQRDAEIALALPPETTLAALEAACREARSLEFANRFRPKPAEVVYVPAGTLHALGPGLVLFEVSETSDVTYRLDDYGRLDGLGRPRQLHLERGLETTQLDAPTHRDLPKIEVQDTFGKRRYAVACRYFAIEELGLREPSNLRASKERVECLTVISGAGRVEIEAGWLAYRPGQTWVVPATGGSYRLVPEKPSRLLRYYVPETDRDFRQPLARRGVSPEMIGRVVFDD